jgi:signal transduction histidine kinase/DNA-binding response OmpR family regulator/ligand-binding sensor domain-containing protein
MRVGLLMTLAVLGGWVQASSLPPGKPLVQSWSMAEYGGQVTNWAIEQAPDGRMLVGNGNYLLTFDGARWRQIDTPQGDRVRSMAIDPDGRVWVGMPNEFGYFEADATGELVYHSLSRQLPEEQQQFGEVYDLNRIDGRVYFGTLNFLFQWDGETLTALSKREGIFRLTLAHQGRLLALIGRNFHDLTEFPADDEAMELLAGLQYPEGVRFTLASSWPDGRVLMGSLDNGLFWLSEDAPPQPASLIPELTGAWPYLALPMDDGSILLGTRYKGVMHLSAEGRLLDHLSERNGLDSNVVSAMTLDREGGLWLALEGSIARVDWFNGLRYYDSDLGVGQANDMIEHRGELLVGGAHGVGVLRADGSDGSRLLNLDAPMLEAFGLLDDANGVLVSGSEGVHRMVFDLDAGATISSDRLIRDTYGYKLKASRFRDVVFAELESGLGLLIRGEDGWEAVQRIEGVDRRPGPIAEAADGTVWAGTTDGLFYRLRWNEADALVLDSIMDADDGVPAGFAWPFELGDRIVLGTSEGGYRFGDGRVAPDPAFGNDDFFEAGADTRDLYKLFLADADTVVGGVGKGGAMWRGERSADGSLAWPRRLHPELPPGQNWFFRIFRGQLWFGRHPGLYRIDLDQLRAAAPPPGTLTVQRAGFPDEDHWLRSGPGRRVELAIDREQPTLRFEYALSSYQRSDRTEYRTRLAGLEAEWSRWSDEDRRDFTQLPAGDYQLQVQARDVQGRVIDAEPVALRVLPRWYESPIAWWVYAFIAIAGLVLSAQWGQARRARRMRAQQIELEQQVAARTAEARASAREVQRLSDARAEFFANVSHELRTPLTLTRAPLEELVREPQLSREGRRYLSLARRNTELMQSLIGQVLDLQKLEAGEMTLRLVRSDLALGIRRVVERFSVLARTESIALQSKGLDEACWAVFDPRHLDTMVSNLLSNAMKFTPADGTVRVELLQDSGVFRIIVEDSGPGVAEEDRSDIFERYRQGSRTAPGGGGTGIGLALVRELIELHGGAVHLTSAPGEGARFVLELPADLEPMQSRHDRAPEAAAVDAMAAEPESPESAPEQTDAPQILLVDDNAELREFLRLRLGRSFRIIEAENGVRGLEQAREHLPDLIVTDGMMPELDGLGLTRAIKADPELDFIPVLMLTARGESDAIVQGLAAGADDYLAKPFDGAELTARINGLIASRRRLKARLQSEAGASETASTATSDLLKAAMQVVDRNLSDASFSVKDWAALMHMDRTTLFRKLKDETGQSPDEFLREARMQRAAELLKRRAGNVAEVAEAVGFASVSSFSRRFRERFGQTPASFGRKS